MATTGKVKGRSVSTGGCVSGFPLHTDISVGNDRHLWLCQTDSETLCWKTPRNEFKSSQGTCLLSRETDSSSRGEEAVALRGQGATEDHDKGTVAPGRRQELLLGCFPKASWDVCLPGQRLACKCLAIFYNSLLSSCLEEKASCWLIFLVWCLCRRDRDISVSSMMRAGSRCHRTLHRDHPQEAAPIEYWTSAFLTSSYHQLLH